MSIATIKAGARRYVVTTSTANMAGWPFLELGPAGTTQQVSTMVIQFTPTVDFVGQFVVCGRNLGVAANEVDVPFVPVPYRRVNLNNLASDYTIVSDPISGVAKIAVPASGDSIALLCAISAGQMTITSWDLQGNATP